MRLYSWCDAWLSTATLRLRDPRRKHEFAARTKQFPFPLPERLPEKINPCPIVEALFELRFASVQPWATMPGLLYAQVRERYREQRLLPLARHGAPISERHVLVQHIGVEGRDRLELVNRFRMRGCVAPENVSGAVRESNTSPAASSVRSDWDCSSSGFLATSQVLSPSGCRPCSAGRSAWPWPTADRCLNGLLIVSPNVREPAATALSGPA